MDEEYRDSRFKKQVIIDYIAGKINRRSASIKLHTSETYVSTLKRQYLRDGIRSPARHTGSKGIKQIHPIRPRRAQFGELVQVDASIHDWLSNGEKWAVYTAIDDATSLVLSAHIAKVESTEGYFRLLEKLVNAHGVPRTLYADRRTTFTFNGDKEVAKRAKIHFKRACDRLGIDIITTSTAQAKGGLSVVLEHYKTASLKNYAFSILLITIRLKTIWLSCLFQTITKGAVNHPVAQSALSDL